MSKHKHNEKESHARHGDDKIETVEGATKVAPGGDQQKMGNETVPGATSDENEVKGTDPKDSDARRAKFGSFIRETHSVSDTDIDRIYNWFNENPK